MAAEGDIDGVVQEMRLQDTSSSRIMIIGGEKKIGYTLAKSLEEDYKIKNIDPDKDILINGVHNSMNEFYLNYLKMILSESLYYLKMFL